MREGGGREREGGRKEQRRLQREGERKETGSEINRDNYSEKLRKRKWNKEATERATER